MKAEDKKVPVSRMVEESEKMSIGFKFFVGMVLMVMLMVVWMFVSIPTAIIVRAHTKSQCLEAGYPEIEMDWAFNRYCVKRVNQTDVVVPVKEATKQ